MIANIKTGAYFKGAFQYNLKKVGMGHAAFMYASGFRNESPHYDEMLDEFNLISQFCPSVSKPVFHTSINFSPDEFLDDDKLKAVIDEYMEKLGYGHVQYVVFKHFDTKHQHVHVISTNIEERHGRYMKINDSFQHRCSESISRLLEKEYGLIVAPEANANRLKIELIPDLKKYGTVNTYQQLADVASYVFTNTRFSSLSELNAILNRYHIACFKNQTKDGNKVYYKFTFQDKETRRNVGISGTPSQLKLNYTSQELDQVFEKNKEEKYNLEIQFKEIGKKLLAQYLFMKHQDLEKALKEKNILKLDDLRYFDTNTQTILSLSQLGLMKRFLQAETIKKEYFTHLVNTATAFRKGKRIFHESTLLKQPQKLEEFRTFLYNKETHLNKTQLDLLFNSYCNYKLNIIEKIEKREKEEDIKFTNKLIDYTNRLHLSIAFREKFLAMFNIFIDNTNTVRVGNTIDSVIHEVAKDLLKPLNVPELDRGEVYPTFSPGELTLIKDCIYDKPAAITEEINLDKIRIFLTDEYIQQYHLEKKDYPEITTNETFYDTSFVHRPQLLNSENEYDPYLKKKRKKKGDDDKDGPITKRRKK